MELLKAINSFIAEHRELVTLIGILLVTFLVTKLLNKSNEKRAKILSDQAEQRARADRRLQLELSRRMKLADFRQAWIDSIRQDFASIIGAKPYQSGDEGQRVDDYNVRIQSVLLKMNPSEVGSKAIFDQLTKLMSSKNRNADDEIAFELTNLVNCYLKAEWDRLKEELEAYDEVVTPQ
ncbi:hypothetical protein [Pseudosulfitobacter koreensis]|uniref:Uncharacterized protein n=1 Tax=Pseudosulfitobacter koreensis TaxID=2968472 RepID=A0ABT1YW79_9RHOB|nr:hypothetical protein [Pseudosulfitobacter koreense]MCR8825148.1 hypothetical protein [Pseudosulfitobacter koreense]